MTAKRTGLLQGPPDSTAPHLCRAPAAAYAAGAEEGGHTLRFIQVAEPDFPLLRSQQAWKKDALPAGLQQAQADIRWAEHIVRLFPLWLDNMPALVYRWYLRAHSVKSPERTFLGFVGIAPVRTTLVGMVGDFKVADGSRWLAKLRRLGQRAQ